MKPRFFVVITGATSRRFESRAAARAFRAVLALQGVSAVVRGGSLMDARPACKHCPLPTLRGFVGRAFCRYHWAGQLHHTPGEVPASMREEWQKALQAHETKRTRPA